MSQKITRSGWGWFASGLLLAIGVAFGSMAFGSPAAGAIYTPFDPSGSVATRGSSINDKEQVVGAYDDSSGNRICYLRHSDGSFTTFGNTLSSTCYTGGLNDKGLITGRVDGQTVQCGMQYIAYVRAQNGILTTFAPAGSESTIPTGINTAGDIVGYFLDSSCSDHSFLRIPKGKGEFSLIDVKGAAGTFATGINAKREVTGHWTDADGTERGFYFQPRSAGKQCSKGGCTYPFEVKDSSGTDRGAGAAINDKGEITGDYTDANGAYHGFSRDAKGKIMEFDAPGAGTGAKQGTFPTGIDGDGVIAGDVVDSSNLIHGFLCIPDRRCTSFDVDVAGAVSGTTHANGINDKRHITGSYEDTSGVIHGYVRSP